MKRSSKHENELNKNRIRRSTRTAPSLVTIAAAVLFTAAFVLLLILFGFPVWLSALLLILFTPAGGTLLQVSVSLFCFTGVAVASIRSKRVRRDMKRIKWNPFNRDAVKAIASEVVTFYKGVPVFRPKIGRSGSFSLILLAPGESIVSLDHERGHNTQLMLMGIATYCIAVAIPSPAELGNWSERGNYYGAPWESIADIYGGASRTHVKKESVNAVFYFAAGLFIVPSVFWWVRWKRKK